MLDGWMDRSSVHSSYVVLCCALCCVVSRAVSPKASFQHFWNGLDGSEGRKEGGREVFARGVRYGIGYAALYSSCDDG